MNQHLIDQQFGTYFQQFVSQFVGNNQELLQPVYDKFATVGSQMLWDFINYEISRNNGYELSNDSIQFLFTIVSLYCVNKASEPYNMGIPVSQFPTEIEYINSNINNVRNFAQQSQRQQMAPQGAMFNTGITPYNNMVPNNQNSQGVKSNLQYHPQVSDMDKNAHNINIPSASNKPTGFQDRETTMPNTGYGLAAINKSPAVTTSKPISKQSTNSCRLPLLDKRENLLRLYEEVGASEESNVLSKIKQLSFISDLIHCNAVPMLAFTMDEFCIPIPSADNNFSRILENLSKTRNLLVTCQKLNELVQDTEYSSFWAFINNAVSTTIINTLKYRYAITTYKKFPWLLNINQALKIFDEHGIKDEMEKIILNKINSMFVDCSFKFNSDISKTTGSTSLLILTKKPNVILIPWLAVHDYVDENIELMNGKLDFAGVNDLIKQAFQLVDEFESYIDIYDSSLTKFRAYRNYNATNSETNYKIISVD